MKFSQIVYNLINKINEKKIIMTSYFNNGHQNIAWLNFKILSVFSIIS